MVQALTEDDSIRNYAQRTRALRAQVIGAGTTVMDIALADKIATCSTLASRQLAFAGASSPTTTPLQLAVTAGADQALCRRVAELLEQSP
jgi:hypothetical protein